MSKIYLLSNKIVLNKDITNLSIFDVEFLDTDIDINRYDALIFTSKNGVFGIDRLDDNWKKLQSFAISNQTAKIIEQYGGNLRFVGKESHGDKFAYELIPLLKDKKALYLRGDKIVSSLINILKQNNITLDEKIVYKTKCKNISDTSFKKGSIFIFTSPSTIECFFRQFSWDNSFKAVAIGKTTAKYFPKKIDFKISSKTDIDECIKLAINWSKV